jgi:ribonuclease D
MADNVTDHGQYTLATADEIAAAAGLARARGRFGIDTEFMSEGRYRALLCLVQVAVDDPDADGSRTLLIDSLTDVDIRPLADLLSDPEIEVVLHAGRQDVAILRRAWSCTPVNIFDTQISAGFAGESAQAGYGNLIGSVLGRSVGKTASYTRWDARPLTVEQLSYAAEDVVHLMELADTLKDRLSASGRLEWAREECRRLETATDERDPETAWERLPRVSQLDPRARAVARELAAWRERSASSEDKPVGSVLQDPPMVELAKRQPQNLQAIEQIRGIHRSMIKRRGQGILDAIVRGRAAEPIPREERRWRSEAGDAPLIALCEALLRSRAMESGLAYELLASRSELEQIVSTARRAAPDPDVRTLNGWRRELVGGDLRDLLEGRTLVGVEDRSKLTLRPRD